jgi:predicted phage terminase large subunit-like protein
MDKIDKPKKPMGRPRINAKKKQKNVLFEPTPGNQLLALNNTADELLIGSILGCGKSLLLLMIPTKYLHLKHFNCLILRSSFPELESGLIRMSQDYYPQLGGVFNQSRHEWVFPSGAMIQFGFLETLDDVNRYRGIQKNIIMYDELSSFNEEVYHMNNAWLRTRIDHKAIGYPERIVATSNPGGKCGDFILERWRPWVSKSAPYRLKSGEIAEINGKTRSCVLLTGEDNPYINRIEYNKMLIDLPPHMKEQLTEGNWDIRAADMEYFNRELIEIINEIPSGIRHRSWDLASSTSKTADYTASVLLNKSNGFYYIEDYFRYKKNTGDVEKLILKTAESDGRGVKQILSIDPGQSGDYQRMALSKLLNGYHFDFIRDNRKKVDRAKPVSSQALNKMIKIVKNHFYNDFMNELEAFSDNPKEYLHDDFVDCLSMAYNSMLTQRAVYRDIEMPKMVFWGSDEEDNNKWGK